LKLKWKIAAVFTLQPSIGRKNYRLQLKRPHQIGQLRGAVWMEALPKPARFSLYLNRKVCQLGGDVFLKETGFYSAWWFQHSLPIRYPSKV